MADGLRRGGGERSRRRRWTACLAAVVVGGLRLSAAPAADGTDADAGRSTAGRSAAPSTEPQKFGYSIGVDLGKSLEPVLGDVDVQALKDGLDDALAAEARIARARAALDEHPGDPALRQALEDAKKEPGIKLDAAQREAAKTAMSAALNEQQQKQREADGRQAGVDGARFLAANGRRPGVKTTASGLQYEVLKEGSGKRPKSTNEVTVHYRGTLISGEEFDSSYSRGQPVTFPLANVIPGWTEGVQLMKTGAKYRFYIPPQLAYGDRGAGTKIEPNATLIFEVELIAVK